MRCLTSLALALLALGAALALTPATIPPGQAAVCPELSSSSSEESCVHACVTDQNCPQGTKCCARSPCGRSCMVPFIVPVPKAGRCPQVQALQTPGPCVESSECSRDDQCDGSKKCCFSLCARRCLDPTVGKCPETCPGTRPACGDGLLPLCPGP
ncbi:whey acidic protein-like isoform X2 [Pteropus medius]|uniref:whey acidic protein-like isoform X2 n=1 Tax=Pteropus vampyrus TaxID=132908 RepID=UPI00196A73C0|nr:whey acidic protein-like isoform X2 [Pteropus giganteus]